MSVPRFSAPIDEPARRKFCEELGQNFCVSAGAGAGKTTAITRRIANLARQRRTNDPHLLSRLVVVTYARLAAEELRVRTRDLLLVDLDRSASGRQTLLADLRSAFFGTIHSFCLELIREQGRFLGLPHNLDLLEDRDIQPLWERFCGCGALDALDLPAGLLARVGRHVSFEQILELARALEAQSSRLDVHPDPDDEPPRLDFSAALDDPGLRSRENTAANQTELRRWVADFDAEVPFLELPKFTSGSGGFLAAVRATVEPYARWLNTAAGALAARIAQAFRTYRQAQGFMTYRDQIYWCHQLIANPTILTRLRARGYIVILDEAQDTDAEMFDILTEITRSQDATPGTWPDDPDSPPPLPGRFCLVGDDQQAIYGERADVAVYHRYIAAFKAGRGGEALEFPVTMRCPRRVIAAVNAIFADGRLPQPPVEFRRLVARADCPDGAAWRLDLDAATAGSQRKLGLAARVMLECEQIARYVQASGLSGLGVAHWGEVAVIAPRVPWLEMAREIFAAHGLPGVLISRRSAARELAEHSWPAALFHVLVHPWDRFELSGVLREIFAVSDVDLARAHRQRRPGAVSGLTFWPGAPSADGLAPRARAALELLHELRAALPEGEETGGFPTLARYVDHVMEQTALAARLEAVGQPADALELLRASAAQAECAGATVRTWARDLVAGLAGPAPNRERREAVHFLTALKAKGLEWPVVIPLGLGCEIRDRAREYPRVDRVGRATQLHLDAVTLEAAHKAAAKQRAEDEFQRMLYVTLTRTQRLLIVPDSAQLYEGRKPNFLDLARWSQLELPAIFDAAPTPPEQMLPGFERQGAGALDEVATEVFVATDPEHMQRAVSAAKKIPKRVRPSDLAHADPVTPSVDHAAPLSDASLVDNRSLAVAFPPAEDPDDALAGVGGIDYGNWWHGILQHYPWSAPSERRRLDYLAEQCNRIDSSAPWATRGREELARLTASAAHREFLTEGTAFLAEVPFAYPSEPREWMEGVMDLVIVTRDGGRLWIIDWKTDRPWPGASNAEVFLDRLAAKYARQLQAYAAVLARGMGRRVDRILLYSTALGEVAAITAE